MKYLKVLGPVAMAVAALVVFAASASATVLTSPAGSTYTGTVQAETEGEMIIHEPFVESRCKSKFLWEPTSHGPASTVKGPVNTFDVTECSGGTLVVPVKLGTFELHTRTGSADGDGTLTWTGAEITYLTSPPVLDCLYGLESQNADVGIVTGSKKTGGTAKVDMAATLIRVGGARSAP